MALGTNAPANWTEVGVAGTAALVGGVPTQNGLCLPNFTQGMTMSSGPVTIMFATPLTNGGPMYFRWADDNNEASSPDQELAIDNVGVTGIPAVGPYASLTAPANNANFTPGSSVAITANAGDYSGNSITNVEFYASGADLGRVTSAPFTLTTSSLSVGSYALIAVASDSAGLMATSAVVNITLAYAQPTVSLTSPASGSTFVSPASLSLAATAASSDATVASVAFYQGTTLLGNVTGAPYTFAWTGVSAGAYSLTAQVTDSYGVMATSSVVSVTVTNPLVASFAGSYTQNFDLALSNSTTTMPAGFTSMYLPGTHFTYTNGIPLDSNAIATATIGSGAATLAVWNVGSAVTDKSYQLFNIGCWDSLNDRALGTDPTGTAGNVIQLALTNNSGAPLSGVVFSYTEKCLTNGATSNGTYTDDGTERLELPGYEFWLFWNSSGRFETANRCLSPCLRVKTKL